MSLYVEKWRPSHNTSTKWKRWHAFYCREKFKKEMGKWAIVLANGLKEVLCLIVRPPQQKEVKKKTKPLTYTYTVLQRGIALREILRRESKTALERIPR